MSDDKRTFLHKVVLVDAIGLLFLFTLAAIWYAAHVLLLIFACVLFAILLYDLSLHVARHLPLSRRSALGLVVVLLFGLLGIAGWLMAPQIAEQAARLADLMPNSLEALRAALARQKLLAWIIAELPPTPQIRAQLAALVPSAGPLFSGLLGGLGNIVIIIFVGIYFALQPALYIEGMIKLVPKARRERARAVLAATGRTLAKWLIGKACSMVLVGTLSAVGLTMLGVPLALILGIIAGLLEFIPYLGPLMAGVPAALIAYSVSPALALYTFLLFLAVQTAESYLITPLIEKKTVSLPPALTILMQLLFGALFGLAGVALATPLTAVLAVLVSMLYVQDMLGDTIRPPPR
ncbi:MAG: AI-2E family transporter [Pseudomonadota bacterium]